MADGRHRCPGGCGYDVRNRLYACPGDWARLPPELRAAISRTAGMSPLTPERAAALCDARDFYLLQGGGP